MSHKVSDFHDIYQKYANEVYRYLLVLTHDIQLSEELTQETFYQAIRSIHSFKEHCSMYTWLCAIAKNCMKSYIRKNKKYIYVDEIRLFEDIPTQDNKQIEGLYLAVSHLKSPYREIVQLHVYDGIPLKDIGRMFGKSESFARVNFHRAKQMLREEMKKDEL